MNDRRFLIVYHGELIEGADFERTVQNLARLCTIAPGRAAEILKGQRVVFKRDIDETAARKYAAALTRVGLRVTLEAVPASEAHSPPLSVAQSSDAMATATALPADGADSVGTDDGRVGSSPPPSISMPTWSGGIKGSGRFPFEFHGSGGEYFRIWIVNAILSILTLGIYSAWAKVRRKQYFYGNTRLDGTGFVYLAAPSKILKGRLVVAALILLFSIISGLLPLVGNLLSLLFIFVLPWLAIRSLAFNARNSAWRNIRFGFQARYGEAFNAYVLWPVLAALTLGGLSPLAYYKQKKFVVDHTRYGTAPFVLNATARNYYGLFLSLLLPLLAGATAIAAGFYFRQPFLALLVALTFYLYAFAAFAVKTGNLLFNNSSMAKLRFDSTLKVGQYLLLISTNSLAIALTLGLFHPWAKARTLRYRLEHLTVLASGDLDRFVASEQSQVDALGDASSDLLDFDFGL